MKKMTEAEADAKATRMTLAAKAGSAAGKDALISAVEDHELDGDEEIGAIITAAAMIFEAVLLTIAEPEVGNTKQANLAVGLFQKVVAPALAKVIPMATTGGVKMKITEVDDAE